jgi:hypothetical protein
MKVLSEEEKEKIKEKFFIDLKITRAKYGEFLTRHNDLVIKHSNYEKNKQTNEVKERQIKKWLLDYLNTIADFGKNSIDGRQKATGFLLQLQKNQQLLDYFKTEKAGAEALIDDLGDFMEKKLNPLTKMRFTYEFLKEVEEIEVDMKHELRITVSEMSQKVNEFLHWLAKVKKECSEFLLPIEQVEPTARAFAI